MLGKLLKYEFKATSRLMLPLYLICIVITLLNKLVSIFDMIDFPDTIFFVINMFRTLTVMLYSFTILSLIVATLIICIIRFYKNLLGAQGYLMFTLPAKTYEHLLAKAITSIVWFITSTVVAIISIAVTILNTDIFNYIKTLSFSSLDHAVYYSVGLHLTPLIILSVILFIVYTASLVTILYSSMSIGNLFNKNKILGSFLGYLIIKVANSVIGSIIAFPISYFMVTHIENEFQFTLPYLIFMIIYEALFAVLYFFVSHYILNKKLNLQ